MYCWAYTSSILRSSCKTYKHLCISIYKIYNHRTFFPRKLPPSYWYWYFLPHIEIYFNYFSFSETKTIKKMFRKTQHFTRMFLIKGSKNKYLSLFIQLQQKNHPPRNWWVLKSNNSKNSFISFQLLDRKKLFRFYGSFWAKPTNSILLVYSCKNNKT